MALSYQRKEKKALSDLDLEPWELVQCKTMMNWANAYIAKVNAEMKIEDPSTQLEDGLRLIALVESLTGESLGRYHKNPRLQPHMIENLNLPLNLVNESVRSKGLKVFYSAEDILDGNMKMILGLFWILISKFMIDYISDGDKSAREGLLLWCQRRTKNYDNVQVTDLYKSFQDGLAFCAIFHSRDPNSVPYSTLTAAGKFQNLEKAFTAGEAIGVPRLIDVEDLKQGGAYMDEKTVMTYLSMMWQAMAEDKKSEQAQEHLKKVIAKERATHGLKQGFAEKAAALTQWIGEQAGFFRGLHFGKEEAAVHDCVTGLNEYRRVTKPTKASEKADLESSLAFINTKLSLDNRAPFEPAAEHDIDTVNDQWTDLTGTENKYATHLGSLVFKVGQANRMLTAAMAQSMNFQQWVDKAHDQLTDSATREITTLAEAEAALAQHELHEDAYEKQFSKLQNLSSILEGALRTTGGIEPSKYGSVEAQIGEVEGAFHDLRAAVHSRSAALHAELLNQRALDAQRMEFSKRAEELVFWIEDVQNHLESAFLCDSVESVTKEIEAIELKQEEISGKWLVMDELATIASETMSDTVANPYARFDLSELDGMLQNLLTKADECLGKLQEELEHQKSIEDMREAFATAAEELVAWSATMKRQIATSDQVGELEDELKQIEGFAAQIESEGAQLYGAVELCNQDLVDNGANASERTKVSIGECAEDFELLKRILSERQKAVQEQIMEKNDLGIDVATMETSKELFESFDLNKDGLLSKEELQLCFKAMELEFPEETAEEYMAGRPDGLTMEDFTALLSAQLKKSDTYEDTRDAFRLLCGTGESVTAAGLRGFLEEDDVQFLLQEIGPNVAPSQEGGHRRSITGDLTYDYQTYLRRVYGTLSEEEEQALEAEKEAARQRIRDEEARREAERQAAAEQARKEEEERQRQAREEQARREEEERRAKEAAEEAARLAAEEARKAAEEARRAAEEAKRAAEEEEAKRLAEEQRKKEEQLRRQQEKEERERLEREKREAEARAEAERQAEIARLKQEGRRGWLTKKGGTKGGTFSRANWNQRYFVIDGEGIMRYYESEKEKKAKKEIALKDCTAFRNVQFRDRMHCLAFELPSDQGRETFIASAESAEEAKQWCGLCKLWS